MLTAVNGHIVTGCSYAPTPSPFLSIHYTVKIVTRWPNLGI